MLVVAGEGWHRGVIGIVASKLVDAFHRPAIVLSIDGDEAHGSCRSIPGVRHARRRWTACAAHLVRFGGHVPAAGLTMERSRIKAFREAIDGVGRRPPGPDDLRPRLRIDGPLGFRQITPRLLTASRMLAPFGIGNPRPMFWTPGVQVADGPRRLKERHLSMSLRHDGIALRGLFWRAAERAAAIEAARAGLDVAYSVEQNTFNGTTYLEVTLADVRAAGADRDEVAAAPADRDRCSSARPSRPVFLQFRAPRSLRRRARGGTRRRGQIRRPAAEHERRAPTCSRDAENFRLEYEQAVHLPGRAPEAGRGRASRWTSAPGATSR